MAKTRREERTPHWVLHAFLAATVLYTVYPVLWVITIAFSGKQSLAIADLPADPTKLDRARAVLPWPTRWAFSNFTSVLADQPFARWMLNSAIVAIGATIVGVALSCTAAYAFSRFKFAGRRLGMMSFLVSQMFPGTLTLIPLYIIIVQWLGLGSTLTGLVIIYATTSIPFSVWMLKGYFDTIPKELEEAAVMEGAGPGRIFWSIVLPLAKPAIAITALFSFMTGWNEFIQAATFMDKEDMYTAPVGLRFFVGGFQQQWGYFAAGSIIVSIPVVLLFLY
ncbi:MAG: sugar ABC transporter permease, partial [Myxococcaceae bacterium]